MIYAYGKTDPQPGQDISYHGTTQRSSATLNLISATQQFNSINDNNPGVELVEFGVQNVNINMPLSFNI